MAKIAYSKKSFASQRPTRKIESIVGDEYEKIIRKGSRNMMK